MSPAGWPGAEGAQAALSLRNVKLVVAYDGTRYHGFQAQARAVPTIQGAIEQALARVTGAFTRVAGAGRTDTGVHAQGQVVSFRTASNLSASVLRRALNALLPEDIAVLAAEDTAPEFHARFSARSREYRYTILNQAVRAPLLRHYVFHVPAALDVDSMAAAAAALVGRHDFAAFAGAGIGNGSTVRRVLRAECRRAGSLIEIDMAADAFLPHMVRNVVGTLLLAGTGKLDPLGFRAVLVARRRALAGPTAPARGLCLMKVSYDDSELRGAQNENAGDQGLRDR